MHSAPILCANLSQLTVTGADNVYIIGLVGYKSQQGDPHAKRQSVARILLRKDVCVGRASARAKGRRGRRERGKDGWQRCRNLVPIRVIGMRPRTIAHAIGTECVDRYFRLPAGLAVAALP